MMPLLDVLADHTTDDGSWRPNVLSEWGSRVVPHCLGKALVLEPMSGLGTQGHFLATEIGAEYVGFDINPDVVAAARVKRLQRASFECLDLLTFPDLRQTPDIVLLGYEAINAFPRLIQARLLEWCRRVCGHNAFLIVDFLPKEARLPFIDLKVKSRTISSFIRDGDQLLTISWQLPSLRPQRSTRFTPHSAELLEMLRKLGGNIITCHDSFCNVVTTKRCLQQMKTLVAEMP